MGDNTYVTDWFWLNPNKLLYGFYRPGFSSIYGHLGPCRSQCIQEGKRCPIYDTCRDKDMIREILPC